MITPHGSENLNPLIVESSEEKESLIKASESMEKVVVSSAAAGNFCLLYTSPSPRDGLLSRMPSSA